MCQYSVTDGFVGDYHLVHLGRFGLGGFGLVFVEDIVALARELKARDVDAVDVSGGGIGGGWEHPIGYGCQVPFADLVAVAREAQDDPNFAVHAVRELTAAYDAYDPSAPSAPSAPMMCADTNFWALELRISAHRPAGPRPA